MPHWIGRLNDALLRARIGQCSLQVLARHKDLKDTVAAYLYVKPICQGQSLDRILGES